MEPQGRVAKGRILDGDAEKKRQETKTTQGYGLCGISFRCYSMSHGNSHNGCE